ncbi:lactadherin-like [Asterias rubens]|uniref:lactadherin-like n=1 Tax=Asterias rubens TaxID=7604 RepID=UPI001454E9A3|nr:lactadherin-like [Asterias rubens]
MITLHHINHVLNPLILMTSFFWIASNCIAESCQMSSYYGPVPEPDPGQPYNKYYWVKSAMEKLRSGRLKGASLNEVCSAEFDGPLGIEDGDILDSDLSASTMAGTYYRASQARLNNQVPAPAWCAYDYDPTPWIQVNFKANVSITGLITQGMYNSNRHVITFRVQYGDSPSSLTDVTTSSGVQLFTGNSDADSHVTNRFSPVLHAQYLRIFPVSWVKGNKCCMRFEVLGCR